MTLAIPLVLPVYQNFHFLSAESHHVLDGIGPFCVEIHGSQDDAI